MEAFMVLLPAFCALSGASAVSPCLDPTDADYSCEVDEDGYLYLYDCGITDEDVDGGDLASCLDNAGQELVVELWLYGNALTALPAGIFEGLTALAELSLGNNALTTLPAGIFEGLTALELLWLHGNALTTLPAGIFEGFTALAELSLGNNALTTLPAGIFEGLTALELLWLYGNALTALPAGIFEGLTALAELYLYDNALTTLPAGIFEGFTALELLSLGDNALTTLPAGIFEGLTALEILSLGNNALTTLPAGIFEGLTALELLYLDNNALTTLPEGIFEGLTALAELRLYNNTLTTLPAGIFEGLTALAELSLGNNALTTLPAGIFEGLTALAELRLYNNTLTTLPAGIFEGLTALAELKLDGNELECLPTSILVEVDDDATDWADGLHVDLYGDECAAVLTPAPSPAVTTAPVAATAAPVAATAVPVAATAAPVAATAAPAESGETPATSPIPTPAPSLGVTSTTSPVTTSSPEQTSTSDSTPTVAGIVSAVAGAALIALAVFLRRRRASRQKTTKASAAPPTHDDGNVEHGGEQPLDIFRPPYSAVVVAGNGDDMAPSHQDNASLRRKALTTEADGVEREGIVPLPAASALDGEVEASAEHAAKDCRARLASAGSAEKLPAATSATTSTANLSTAERDELSQFHQRERVADAAPVSGELKPEEASSGGPGASSAADDQNSADIGLGRAVLAAAQELVHHCQIPGVSEAATAVCMMATLVTDGRDNARASESRLRQCSTVVMALKRAAKVADKGGDTIGEVARGMIEDVHGAIFDLVQLIKTYQSKNKLSRLFMSTLFKRRQEELNAVVDQAIMRLQLGLQLQVGQDVGAVKDKLDSVKEGIDLYQLSLSEAASESVAEDRRVKRQRKLDQVEIPAEYLSITDELLGKGGFGEVYLADYNGHNAAAKVLHIARMGALDETQKQREASQHRAFLRELEAMIRLRSLNTVNVYGAVTSLPDRMVLVMELLAGGDLLTLLRKSKKALPGQQSRRIIRDICTGMAFLHGKNTVHGDLKSANVLLDGDGRAKIADFGTSRWTQTTNSTGLATYTTRSSQTTQMSIAWSAPEVLESEGSSYESDVYSFGIVVWEVISREVPWAKKTRSRDILTAVLRGVRPSFHVDAPADVVDIANACWCGEPKERTTFRAILQGIKAKDWGDE
ncbi:Tyrosine kinase specific for activated (GTP-bound) p21cdc42Hs/ leucine rich repeat protein [Ectocarpus siliculosus]|uniref:Tyrosine kinase specific for activated (GTP-bound) p21cdc42Hs/ leucine rich repeat protein n=1 Tax=Ectocarpus siliculosus TaxID=2880 RepID=D7G7F2_ECTSI|nr:Tyrosine kinase specific for activated (GTP-bound) p21cdc42Hs/ leucine rich repeat protein [Ectocarpus siliculosus]|eukprot:CBJ27694.1 Tyrosine kinase specific for activated (GTP-bound) p21cdc42Hs/ leucine rich repeat protein [Ectocarpus siliculosus]